MISKYLVPGLVATVMLAGLSAPAQAAVGDPTAQPDSLASIQSTEVPTDAATDEAVAAPSATAIPKVGTTEQTQTPTTAPIKPSAVPSIQAVAPRVAATATTESAAAKLKTNKVSGNLSGTTLKIPKNEWREVKGKITQNAWGNARSFRIEIYSSSTKKWSTYKRGQTDAQGNWKEYIEKASVATQIMRLVVDADDTYEKYSGPKTTIQRGKTKITIAVGANSPTIHSVPWEQQRLRFSINDSSSSLPFQLQKKSGKKWVRVSGQNSKRGTADYSFKLPLGNRSSKDGTVAYRVAMTGNSNYEAVGSASRNVRWENPNRYTGTAKKAYDFAKGYCPSVLIRMDGSLGSRGLWGEHSLSTTPAYTKIYTKVPAKHLRTVALHECAHHLQWKTANIKGNGGWSGYTKRAAKIFGSNGFELAAECMAYNMGPKSYWAYGASASMCSKSAAKNFALASIRGQRL